MSLRLQLGPQLKRDSFEEAAEVSCAACGAAGMVAFYEVESVPAQTCVLLDSESDARAFPMASVLLGFCEACGFIQNTRFEPDLIDYSLPTEESQAFSPKFNEFAASLADDLVHRYGLVGRSVFEIGCGKGDFLMLLAARGVGQLLGIDPGFTPSRGFDIPTVEFRREAFDGDYGDVETDFVVTRHLMEHVPNVGEFFVWLIGILGLNPTATLFTEVPDTSRVLSEGAFWDIYHEHCSYFTAGSLARSLRRSGLGVKRLDTGYQDQYLLSEADLGLGRRFDIEESPKDLAEKVASFTQVAALSRDFWSDVLRDESKTGRVAIWGGGSKASAFLASVDSPDVVVVDINPHKQGKWLPGMPIMIQSPDVLGDVNPSLVVVMNPIYSSEIEAALARMGLEPRLTTV